MQPVRTPTVADNVAAFRELLRKKGPYSTEDIDVFRETYIDGVAIGGDFERNFQARASMELIDAIQRFDTASSKMVQVTIDLNQKVLTLTQWAVGFAAISVVLAVGSIVATTWPYLVWWISNGFRFS